MSSESADARALSISEWGIMPMAVVMQLAEKPKEPITRIPPIGRRAFEPSPGREERDPGTGQPLSDKSPSFCPEIQTSRSSLNSGEPGYGKDRSGPPSQIPEWPDRTFSARHRPR